MNDIKIGDRLINDKSKTFIIAEIGVNHNGSVELAKKMINEAKSFGADAVKFQTFKAENLVSKSIKKFYDMVKKLELNEDEFKELSLYAKNKNIIFFSTPTDEESVDILCELDVPAFKIASGDITHLPFIRYAAKKNIPIILSTGMSYLGEVEEAINTIYKTGNNNVALTHCVSSYPAKIEETNLNVIKTLKSAFDVPVGFSDHTPSIIIPIVAASMGAKIIEKHFTLDKNMDGPDHKSSADVTEFNNLVKGIREMEKSLGSSIKQPSESEMEIRKTYRKSIVLKNNIEKGDFLNSDKLTIKRPGIGIEPKFLNMITEKKAKKNLKTDEVLQWDLIE